MLTNGFHSPEGSSALKHHLAGPSKHDAQRWIVQKFGGTSVGKFADKIAEDIVRRVAEFLAPSIQSC